MSPLTVTLTVANGPLVGREYEFLDSDVYILGRAAECHPQLPDVVPYKDISRHHCLLSIRLPELRLLDLCSTNGTFVNGMKLGPPVGLDPVPEGDPAAATIAAHADPTGWHPLKDGDVIALAGSTVLCVRVHVREEEKPLAGGEPSEGARPETRCPGSHSCCAG
jgi:pSer/pThr/pTyr-binding forkhead associated (FHA) protein